MVNGNSKNYLNDLEQMLHLWRIFQKQRRITTVYATIPERAFTERASFSVVISWSVIPALHAIIQCVRAQQKVVQGLWHAL